ncbi:MAG: aspartate aminotransferase family protein [Candidatus Bathyarchaeota archaeon]|nr:MAG: aspartate aminotransferase family protein [Candidatus Bathyarchaeota archaeon]
MRTPEDEYLETHRGSHEMWVEAKGYLPGGVSAQSHFKPPFPLYFSKGHGSRLWDVDGNEYIDTHCGSGPILLGRGHPVVLEALEEAKTGGLDYGGPSDRMLEWTKIIRKHVPSLQQTRFVNTGSEAVTYAIRVARGYTGKAKICKVEGCYHGSTDYSLVSIAEFGGSPENPEPAPHSRGLTILDDFVLIPWNDVSNSVRIIEENVDELACVILEPVSGTGLGFVEPDVEYLKALREVTEEHDVPLIYDEIMVGFRWGGMECAQGYYGVTPDLTTLGKIIGGGAPVGCYGGRGDIMEMVSPLRDTSDRVYQSGTYSGNPFTATVGLAVMKFLDENHERVYRHVNSAGERIRAGLRDIIEDQGIRAHVAGGFSTYDAYYIDRPQRNLREFMKRDRKKQMARDLVLVNWGVYKQPGHFAFTCLAHSEEDVQRIIESYDVAFEIAEQTSP